MTIISHRGWWLSPEEKNTEAAFRRSFESGFGTETDFRDSDGQLVISHDPAAAGAMPAGTFFSLHSGMARQTPLALNIKADGVRKLLKPFLDDHAVQNYFCFDMSVPETIAYRREGFRYFTRESEYEPYPALYEDAAGVWMDMFQKDWIIEADIRRHLDAGKQVALVSPDLHGRPHEAFWLRLREAGLVKVQEVILCTDHPGAAREFFHA